MQESFKQQASIENPTEFLKEGQQTKITPQIQKIAEGITGSLDEKLKKIINFTKTLSFVDENKNDIFRKRTADEIISDGYVSGCTDRALVFLVVARALNIPSKYIETINLDFLKEDKENYSGHVYASVFEQGLGWKIIDPETRNINADIKKDNRILFKEGFDSWDIGITDFNSLKSKFDDFKKEYNK